MTTEISDERYRQVQDSPEFGELRRTIRGFVFPMTIAFFLWYALYVLLSAYARGFMAAKVVGNINVALIFGLLQFVSTFVIAWLYARFAASKIDPLADRLNAQLTGEAAGTSVAGTSVAGTSTAGTSTASTSTASTSTTDDSPATGSTTHGSTTAGEGPSIAGEERSVD